MSDKIMAILSLAIMIAFLGVVCYFVPDIDLIIVVTIVSGLAIYDFWETFRTKQGNGG